MQIYARIISTFIFLSTVFGTVVMPVYFAHAQPPGDDPQAVINSGDDPQGETPGDDVRTGNSSGKTYRLESPLTAETIPALILQVIDVILVFATPIIVLYIMYGGFQLVTAGGEAGKIEHGRQTIMWAIIGGVIILGARVIIDVLQSTVESFMNA